MSTIQRSLVSDQVFRALIADILGGRYMPGEKLPTQRALAADLGVNMASVREAVKRLEQLRLIEVRQGDAMRVRDWRAHSGLDVMSHVLAQAGELDRHTLADVLEARGLILVQIAKLAAERRSVHHAERLQELAQRFATAPDAEAAQQIDWGFYTEMAEAGGNLLFRLAMNSLRELYFERAALFRPVVARQAELAPLLARAARAIRDGEPRRAASAVQALAEAQAQRLVEALEGSAKS